MTEKTKFPTEIVDLPSKGYFYPPDNPLSSGKVEIKYMTAKEEDILTSQNLIKKGIVLDKLLQSLIVSNINYDDLLIGDKNALMIASRILGYGKEYKFQVDCPSCGVKSKDSIDLTLLNHKEIDFTKYSKGENNFEFKLPAIKIPITFKLLTHRDEKKIDSELKSLKKINKFQSTEITTRLKNIITSVDGDDDASTVREFVDKELFSRDSLELRNHLLDITPDVDMNYFFSCDDCGSEQKIMIPLTVEFFWPSGRG